MVETEYDLPRAFVAMTDPRSLNIAPTRLGETHGYTPGMKTVTITVAVNKNITFWVR